MNLFTSKNNPGKYKKHCYTSKKMIDLTKSEFISHVLFLMNRK